MPVTTATATPTTIPILDAHNHLPLDLTPEAMISVMDGLGVSRTVVMALGSKWGTTREERTLAAYEKYPDRVIPFIGLNGVSPISRAFLEYVDGQLATGKFRGLGELLSRHYGFATETVAGTSLEAGDYTIPMDSPGVQDLMCLAAKHNVVLVVHMETIAATVAALERALQKNPATKVIWAHQTHIKTLDGSTAQHARKADPEQIADLLDKYPNLYADIAPGFESRYLSSGDGRLPDRWRDLYERYSDRFVVGLDGPFLANWEEPNGVARSAKVVRNWLAGLTPSTQARLAAENMERILEDKPSPGGPCEFLTR
ncbi:MAG: amidohydrolase family protein [Chloroflexi bacterium]|nr:amidohydrolase family protein [Chloroflexota bacterium]